MNSPYVRRALEEGARAGRAAVRQVPEPTLSDRIKADEAIERSIHDEECLVFREAVARTWFDYVEEGATE